MQAVSVAAGLTATSPSLTQAAATWVAPAAGEVVGPLLTPPITVPHPDGLVTPPRRSGRFGVAADGATATDEDSMRRAMRRKVEYNLDSHGMDMSSKSFLSFCPSSISSKFNNVGISLGSDSNQVSVSTRVLRHIEFDRLTEIGRAHV